MNKRLLKIASMLEYRKGVIDVGTDHGYLPAYLARKGKVGNILASDINPLPLQSAINTAKAESVEDKIRFILSDGLELCPPEDVDCIVIAGMGGDTICGILDRAAWCMDGRYQLVLQPVTKAEILRYWLAYNGFCFEQEECVEDSGLIYQIISARFGDAKALDDAELFTGIYELASKNELFMTQLEKLIVRFEKAVAGLSMSRDGADVCRAEFYSQILEQLLAMKERHMNLIAQGGNHG